MRPSRPVCSVAAPDPGPWHCPVCGARLRASFQNDPTAPILTLDSEAPVARRDDISLNERRLLDIVLRDDQVTRADVTRITGLTAQSSLRLTAALEERGLLRSGDRVVKGRGQPSRYLALVPDALYTIGLSIMSDGMVAVLMNFRCESLREMRAPLAVDGEASIPEQAKRLIDRLLDAADPLVRERLFGIGVAVTGYFVGAGRRLNTPHSLDALALVDLEAELARHFDRPVLVENDGNAAAIGENLAGVGRTARTLVYFYFAEGFGGGVVIDGTPWRGAHGNAGEIGGMVPPELMPSPTLDLLRRHVASAGREFPTLSALLDAFDPAWPGVEKWLAEVAPTLSMIASAAAVLIDPDAIVLGGRIPSSLADLLLPRIRIHNRGRRDMPRPEPRMLATASRFDAAAIGAATLPLKAHFFL